MTPDQQSTIPEELGARREWYISRLAGLYSKPEAVAWLDAPHPLLSGLTAWYCIKTGQQDRVLAIIDQLETGAYI